MSRCTKHGTAKKNTYGGKRMDEYCRKCDTDITPVLPNKKRARREGKKQCKQT